MEFLASDFKRKGRKKINIYIYMWQSQHQTCECFRQSTLLEGVLLLSGDAQPQKVAFCPIKLTAKPKEVW